MDGSEWTRERLYSSAIERRGLGGGILFFGIVGLVPGFCSLGFVNKSSGWLGEFHRGDVRVVKSYVSIYFMRLIF